MSHRRKTPGWCSPAATPGRCAVMLLLGCVALGGCKGPSQANIKLRKENQSLRDEILALKRRQAADAATIAAVQRDAGTVERLPQERFQPLFTTAGIRLGRLTGTVDQNPAAPGSVAIRVQVTPYDLDGDALKAAGSFVIEAFDFASAEPRRVGRWEFDLQQSRQAWLGRMMQYGYLLSCPLSQTPPAGEILLKVTFRDELTGREFTEQRSIRIG